MQDVPYIVQGRNITMLIDGQTMTVTESHRFYDQIVDALKNREFDLIPELYDLGVAVRNYSNGVVEVVDGEVLFDGQPLHNTLADRLLQMMEEGFDIDPLANFIENLMENPSQRAVEELYLFLETNRLPITEDGHFLAYKNVREDYTDIHSGTFDNSVGSVCDMPRNAVDDERDRTCSTGLHFCSLEYLKSFPGQHTMILKINPADVVSIPRDYNNTKGRCCRYEVIGEHEGEDRYQREAYNTSVAANVGGAYDNTRPVVAVDEDGLVYAGFDDIYDAARWAGVPASYIRRVLKGERRRTAGFHWAYENEYEEPLNEDLVDDLDDLDPSDDPFIRDWRF